MIADSLINAARELDPAFTVQRHPRRVALNWLSRLQRRLVAEWVKLDETAIVDVYTITFPLADFDAGEELVDPDESVATPLEITATRRPLSLFLRDEPKPVDMELIRWGSRNRRVQSRAAYLVGSTMFFTGHVEDYEDVERVEFTYTATPKQLASPAAELVLPLSAEEVCVTSLGGFFARRMNDKELARPRREYIQEAADAEALWLDEIRRRQGATISQVREVW